MSKFDSYFKNVVNEGYVQGRTDLSLIDNLIEELQNQKDNGVVRLVFTTPDQSQDFLLKTIEQNQEDDLAFVYLEP